MNYYANMYSDTSNPEDIQIHISIIEGIYEGQNHQKARVIGDVNISKSSFSKYVKHPYNIINTGEFTITLKKRNYNSETHCVSYEETYTLLSHLLTAEGYAQERIAQITTAIHNISNDKTIKSNHDCIGGWIIF